MNSALSVAGHGYSVNLKQGDDVYTHEGIHFAYVSIIRNSAAQQASYLEIF